jgi:hypothetical protein
MNKDPLPELRALNARFINNFVTNDVPSHDAIIHARFTRVGSDGSRMNRADYLADWATGFDPAVIPYWDYRDERIDVFGDTALVYSVNKWTVVRDGKENTGMSCYTDIYVREAGSWKCIQAQISGVTPANYPPDSTIVRKWVRGKVTA